MEGAHWRGRPPGGRRWCGASRGPPPHARRGNPGASLQEALDYVSGWYRARGLPAMIAVPLPLPDDCSASGLDAELADRGWAIRPGPAFVMVAHLPLAAAGSGLPAGAV